jgi:acyl-coenzyme A thioesterase PaaI-like protein
VARTPAWPDLAEALKGAAKPVFDRVPETLKQTLRVRALGITKIPLIFFVSPTVVELTDQRAEVRIPLNRRTRNHLGSMYFGTLAVGADLTGGLMAWQFIERDFPKLVLVFKDFHADFLKRPEGDVHFSCEQGSEIHAMMARADESGERENFPFEVLATVPSQGPEPVARFTLTLSVKRKKTD